MSGVSLVVPVAGLLDVYHHDHDIDRDHITRILRRRGRGSMMSLGIVVEGKVGGTVNFLHEPTEPVNTRAREALAHLTGIHILLTGPVMFTGVPEEKIGEVVAMLSTEETSGQPSV